MVKVEVTDIIETTKKENAAEMYRYYCNGRAAEAEICGAARRFKDVKSATIRRCKLASRRTGFTGCALSAREV